MNLTRVIIWILVLGIIGGACSKPPRGANCLPISFPDSEVIRSNSYEVRVSRIEAEFQVVKLFFDNELEPDSFARNVEGGDWLYRKINDEKILYECYDTINNMSSERGCILITDEKQTTMIETVWYISGDEAPICEQDLSINP